jgi:hypothetical protein
MYITDGAAQLAHKPAASSGKIVFLPSRMSPLCEGLLVLDSELIICFASRTVADNGQGVDPRRSDAVVGSRLVEGFAQQLDGQIEPESGNKEHRVCPTLPMREALHDLRA